MMGCFRGSSWGKAVYFLTPTDQVELAVTLAVTARNETVILSQLDPDTDWHFLVTAAMFCRTGRPLGRQATVR